MGYQELTKKYVNKAFKMTGNLAKEIVFKAYNTTAFDFNNKTTDRKIIAEKTLVAFIKNTEIKSNTIKKTVVVVRAGLPDLSIYDEAVLEGVVWKIGDELKDTGFTLEFEIFKSI